MTNKNTAAVNRGLVSSLVLLPALRGHVNQELLRCGPQNYHAAKLLREVRPARVAAYSVGVAQW